MPRAANGALIDSGTVVVELSASGGGTAEILFAEVFIATPRVHLQAIAADSGTWSVGTITTTGATVTASGSDIRSTSVELAWVSMEPR
jgi:hypothetical protein